MAAGQGIGALLRREGLYSSHLSDWPKARERGVLEAMAPKKRRRKPDLDAELKKEVVRLRRENDHLRTGLDQAKLIIDVQKKLSRLLGLGEKSRWPRRSNSCPRWGHSWGSLAPEWGHF